MAGAAAQKVGADQAAVDRAELKRLQDKATSQGKDLEDMRRMGVNVDNPDTLRRLVGENSKG